MIDAIVHRLRPAVFADIPESEPLFIECPHCARGVPFSKVIQEQLAVGGVGHQCPNCNRFIAVVVGSCCNSCFSIDDNEWDQLAEGQSLECPGCGSLLCMIKRPEIVLGTSFREMPTLSCFSSRTNEANFIEAAKTVLSALDSERLALYHSTTYERLSLAADQIDYLQSCELTSSFAVFNNPHLEDDNQSESQLSSSVLQNLVFQITTSLSSAIESLVQEVNIAIGTPWKESRVGYQKLQDIPTKFAELNAFCSTFIQQPDYV